MPTPLLILSDAPTAGTGLSRICRDLAVRIHEHLPEFRVATLGGGGQYSRHLGFPQYEWNQNGEFVVHELPDVWGDFAGDEKGIVLTVWDSSRLLWFSRPETCEVPRLKQFLVNAPFDRWGYIPVDASGPNDKFTGIIKHTLLGYDRVLFYSKWAAGIAECSIGNPFESLPHGIRTDIFKPRHRATARHGFGQYIRSVKDSKPLAIPDDATLVGVVATNQARKDWGLAFSAIAELAKDRSVILWGHTDAMERSWSIPSLLNDFGVKAVITVGNLSDEAMSHCYSACDITFGIGIAEGFGYPIFESLACGCPVLHGDDGGAAEHLPEEFLVIPNGLRLEGPYNCVRNVYSPHAWRWQAKAVLDRKLPRESMLPPVLDWDFLWPRWAEWLRKGIA